MKFSNKRLSLFSEAEEAALYEVPDFDDEQRLQYLNFNEEEQKLIQSCSSLSDKVHCALQMGYFKAKHYFFRVHLQEAEEDVKFILDQYFPEESKNLEVINQYQYYEHCKMITKHFGYQLWKKNFEPLLHEQIELSPMQIKMRSASQARPHQTH